MLRWPRRKKAAALAYAAGALLVLSNTSGSTVLVRLIVGLAEGVLPGRLRPVVSLVGLVLVLLAGLGGFTVIAGGWVIHRKSRRLGAFLVALGAGLGLLGVLVQLAVTLERGGDPFGYLLATFASVGGLGILLSIVARRLAVPSPLPRLARRVRRRVLRDE